MKKKEKKHSYLEQYFYVTQGCLCIWLNLEEKYSESESEEEKHILYNQMAQIHFLHHAFKRYLKKVYYLEFNEKLKMPKYQLEKLFPSEKKYRKEMIAAIKETTDGHLLCMDENVKEYKNILHTKILSMLNQNPEDRYTMVACIKTKEIFYQLANTYHEIFKHAYMEK